MRKRSKNAPRTVPDYKFWMSHPSHKEKFTNAYEKACAVNPPTRKDRLKFQCEVARSVYALEPEEVKQAIALENAEAHSAKFAAFKKLLSGDFTLEGVGELSAEDKQL